MFGFKVFPEKMRILVVDCPKSPISSMDLIGEPKLKYRTITWQIENVEAVNLDKIHCILIRLDLGSQVDMELLETLSNRATAAQIPIVGMSIFNVVGAENLMAQIGISKYFPAIPSYLEFSDVVSTYRQHVIDRKKQAAS